MIRFIIKRRMDNSYDAVTTHFETLDADVPTLEQALQRGGLNCGGPGYDISELVGVEIRASAELAVERTMVDRSDIETAIQAAGKALYFDDSSDYAAALWAVLRALDKNFHNELRDGATDVVRERLGLKLSYQTGGAA